MKKIIFLILVCIFIFTLTLTACTYQGDKRPDRSDTEVWICEDPYFELYWSYEKGYVGKLCIDENEYNIIHLADHGASIYIYEYVSGEEYNSDEAMKYCLFSGKVNYGKEKITITVDVDYKNIFDGKNPTMEFVKYNIDEYFNEK